jgi:hypothetical protein
VRFVFTFPDLEMGELIRKSDSVATQQNFCWERKRETFGAGETISNAPQLLTLLEGDVLGCSSDVMQASEKRDCCCQCCIILTLLKKIAF